MHTRTQYVLGCLLLALVGCLSCEENFDKADGGFQAWVADPHHRVYPGSFGRDLKARDVVMEGGRNELMICQLAVKSPRSLDGLSVELTDFVGPKTTLPGKSLRVRYPQLIPVDENGQLTPDPLKESPDFSLKSNCAQSIWVDLRVPADAAPGDYSGTLSVVSSGKSLADFDLTIKVLEFTLPPVTEDHFYFNILMDPGSIARQHKVQRWSEEHWTLIEKYVENWALHSQDAVTVFIVEDPWVGDTGFPVAGVLVWELPGKWEDLGDPQFQFDYGHFDRFVQMCLDAGIDENVQCWSPVMMPHLDYSLITYEDTVANQIRSIKVEAGSNDYKRVWSQFAESFESHLREKGWLELTTIGLDEISTGDLDRIVPVFQEIAPDLQLMVSGGDEKGKYADFSPETAFHYGYIESEVPLPDIKKRRSEGKRTLLYTAVSPLYPNTFIFSEPLESRMLPWLVWKYDFDGYIRWAWNFWVDGFWEQPRYKWRSGDMFFVYPGEDGPLDSIRSEMLLKGAQDYECLWMIRERLGELRRQGQTEKIREIEKKLGEAMELATQQADPVRPYRPLPSDLDGARKQLNQILVSNR